MKTTMNRRELIGAAMGTGVAACMPNMAGAQSLDPAITVARLRHGLMQISGAGGNVVVAAGDDGILMVDSGEARRSAELLEYLHELAPDRPVDTVFNTHWHWDHTGANEALGTDATIIAHENTKLWLGGDFYVEWEDRHYRPRPAAALPTKTCYTSDAMTWDKLAIEYGYLPLAHTDGDLYVFFPNSNVLVAGDTVSVGRYPVPDYSTGGWIGGLLEATRTLLELADADTLIVPGSGPVQSRADLSVQYEMLSVLMERLVGLLAKGWSPDEMVASGVTRDFDEKWGDPRLFVANVYRGLWAHHHRVGVRILG